MLDIREHRKNPDRLSDVLPWAALAAPDVVLNKDGSLQATVRYRGPDLDSSTEEELLVKAAHINNVLRRLGSSWAIYAEASRNPALTYPESSFPDPISALIDEQRRDAFSENTHFESSYYLTLLCLPPEDRATKLTKMFLHSEASEKTVDYDAILQNFRSEVARVFDLMERVFPEVELLEGDALLTYLHSTISPKRHVVRMPEIPMYLDSILPDTALLSGFSPKLGDHFISVIGLLSFPGHSSPGILDALNHLPIAYRWVTRFICLDKTDAKKELEGYQRKWFAKRKGLVALIKELITKEESAVSDTDALRKAQDAEDAIVELGSDEISYGFFTTSVVLLHPEPDILENLTAEVERVINSAGFTCRRETVNAVDAFLGAIPGNTQRNVRRPLINTVNLSHLLPGASALWSGQEENSHLKGPPLFVAETSGNTPFRLVHHIGDVGHMLILGPTGSGKSTLLNFIEAQFLRYENAQIYIFDKGQSAFTLTAALGGDYYDLGAENAKLLFQPLSIVDDAAERKWAHDWLCALAEKENVKPTPEVKSAIWEALSSLAATPKEQRTLHAFTVYLQNMELRAAFEPFTHSGAYGRLIDNAKDSLCYGRFQCFEMERLMDTPAVVAPVLSYLFHRLESRFDGSPTLLVLDEAWLFLDHPVFATKIREWLKTLRKLNVSVIFATQSLADVDASSIAPTLKEACFTKIYLPNAIALQPDAAEFYKRFGLNDRQIEILACATPKRDYYYTSPLGNRLFDLALDKLALAYCAGVSKDQTALVRELITSSKDTLDFNVRYLERKGFTEYARTLAKLMEVKDAA